MRRPLLASLLFLPACAVPQPSMHAAPAAADQLFASTAPATRQDPMPLVHEPAVRRPQNHLDIMFGASWWDELGDLDPTGVSPVPGRFGRFDDWGFAFDMGFDRVVASNERSDLTLGLEVGWSTFENDGSGLTSPYSDITASMVYITPAVRWMLHLSRIVTIVPGIGAGYYGFSIDEYETYYYGYWWGYSARTLNQDSAFGGFASLACDFHLSPTSAIRIDNKFHLVDFDGLQSLMPREDDVGGPIYTLEAGFVFSF
jgi:hypothetical protein